MKSEIFQGSISYVHIHMLPNIVFKTYCTATDNALKLEKISSEIHALLLIHKKCRRNKLLNKGDF